MDIKIKKLLEQGKFKYKIISHRKVYTAFNSAETLHAKTQQVVKTVLVKTSADFALLAKASGAKLKHLNLLLVAVPAGKRIDLKKIAAVVNALQEKHYKILAKSEPKTKKPAKVAAKLAGEKDITRYLKTKVGLIAPFGGIFGLLTLMDKKMANNKKLVISAQSYTESLELAVKDYVKLANPIIGNFTE